MEPLPPTGGPPLASGEAEAVWELWHNYQPLASLITPLALEWSSATEGKFPLV